MVRPNHRHQILNNNRSLWLNIFPRRLSMHCVLSLADAKAKIEAWRLQYNKSRPHTALAADNAKEFALAAAQMAAE
jgi:putative transposase